MKSKLTIETYDKYHEVYDTETVDFWENFPQRTIQEFIKRLPGKRVLNIGSGPGRDSLLLRAQNVEVVCLDASKEMIKRTKKLGFESVQADMRELNFPKNSFDGVWAYTSLLHVSRSQMEKVIKKVHEILKTGGVFLIGMIEGEFEGDVERESMPGVIRYFRYYPASDLQKLIEGKGFKFEYQEKYTPHAKTYLSQVYLAS